MSVLVNKNSKIIVQGFTHTIYPTNTYLHIDDNVHSSNNTYTKKITGKGDRQIYP